MADAGEDEEAGAGGATCGRSIPSRTHASWTARARFAAVASSPAGSGGVSPKPGMSTACTSRSASSSGDHRLPDRARAAEPVDEEERLMLPARALPPCAHRAPGFAKSACTSPIRRSRKPASEELR
jgi:hypothetical protein